jgi:catechol 2,3-dioxygenase
MNHVTNESNTVTRKSIHSATHMGTVSLTVSNLDSQIEFYRALLGFTLHWRKDNRAGLGAGREDLLEFVEQPGAVRHPRTTGLYHFAVLFPDRHELARALGRLFQARYENYPTDHIMTKTTYLDDPEGQTVELYIESPEDGTMGIENGGFFARRTDGTLSNGREPLDVESMFSYLRPEDRLDEPNPPETKIGHVHLYVRDVPEAVDFYTRVIGFDDMGSSARLQAGFVSAGGYHHHVGLNSWIGRGRPPAPEGALGLRHFTVVLPDRPSYDEVLQRVRAENVAFEEREEGLRVRDPSQNGIIIKHS